MIRGHAITTKYIGPTNYRPSRVKAKAHYGSVTISWDHALNTDENHEQAARALIAKRLAGPDYDYTLEILAMGINADDNGYTFIAGFKEDKNE